MYLTARMGPNGFGNEFVKLAKLLICRKELGVQILPSYWRSPYRYALPRELCYTSRIRRAFRQMSGRPIVFGRDEHLSTGQIPVEDAFAVFIKEQGLHLNDPYLIEFSDFAPGLETVEGHGEFLHEVLWSCPDVSSGVLSRVRALNPRKLIVGIHIRRGDFRPALPLGTPWPSGQWNIQIPIEWYDRVCSLMQSSFQGRIQFVVSTNSNDVEVDALCSKYNAHLLQTCSSRLSPDVADMLTLASCDVLISSASWFSGWPVVLKPKPWLWYEGAHGEPPWGRDSVSVYLNAPALPDSFLTSIEQALSRKGGRSDKDH